jgi:serine phosphatase RsbU (regulator of sigma subunit)
MEAQIAAAKVAKYARSESGDTLEMVERPGGGLSFVLVDGQRSGKSAKAISNVVARKAISLLAEGVRDGATARAASDYLYTYRAGKVLATLNIVSVDLQTETLVVARNNPSPVVLIKDRQVELIEGPSDPVGIRRGIRPVIEEISLVPGIAVIVFTDGLTYAGDRRGQRLSIVPLLKSLLTDGGVDPQRWANMLLQKAVELDEGRPNDDISVLVVAIQPKGEDEARHLYVRMPL